MKVQSSTPDILLDFVELLHETLKVFPKNASTNVSQVNLDLENKQLTKL